MWVSGSAEVSENGSAVAPIPGFPNFHAATLQCSGPVYTDWAALGTVHVFHEGIVPEGLYAIRAIDMTCADLADLTNYSDPLELATAKFGDTIEHCSTIPCLPPEGVVNIIDVTAIIGAFISDGGAIIKARAEMEPGCPDLVINISDAVLALTGFQGLSPPFAPTAAHPCDSECPNPLP